MNREKAIFLIAGVAFGLTAAFLTGQVQHISEGQASQKLISTLEAQSGQQLEAVSIKSENGLYKIDLSDSQNQLSTYHVTKDGRMATNGMSDLDSLRQTIVAQRQFAGCLSDRGAVLYGNASQQATVTQIQILGGPNTASSVYQDVGNEGVLEQAAQIGIQRVPSLHYNGSILSGVNQISQISQFTGCQLSTQ